MKHFDNNELNPNKIIRLLNNRVVVDSNGYNSEKNRYFYRYIQFKACRGTGVGFGCQRLSADSL